MLASCRDCCDQFNQESDDLQRCPRCNRVWELERLVRALEGEVKRLADRIDRPTKLAPESEAVALLREMVGRYMGDISPSPGRTWDAMIGDVRRYLASLDNPCPGARHVPVDDGGLRGSPEIETTRSES